MNPDHPIHRDHALLRGRYSELGRAYLITVVTLNRQPWFSDWPCGHCVAIEIGAASVETLAWVVMPDHLHWLMVLGDQSLAETVGRMKSCSAIAVNRHLGRQGVFWQKGYHDHAVRSDEDLQKLANYVVTNPLRAGLVERMEDYRLWGTAWM